MKLLYEKSTVVELLGEVKDDYSLIEQGLMSACDKCPCRHGSDCSVDCPVNKAVGALENRQIHVDNLLQGLMKMR